MPPARPLFAGPARRIPAAGVGVSHPLGYHDGVRPARRRRPRPASATTKGDNVPQPARPGIRLGQAAGLTVFVVTAALLTSLVITRVVAGISSLQTAALAFSTAAAAVAVFAMLFDAIDLWLRGRRMTAYSVKMFRSLVFVAILGALASSLLGGNSALVLVLAPSMIVYFFIVRATAVRRPAAGAARDTTTRASAAKPGASRSRQRKGGKKHR